MPTLPAPLVFPLESSPYLLHVPQFHRIQLQLQPIHQRTRYTLCIVIFYNRMCRKWRGLTVEFRGLRGVLVVMPGLRDMMIQVMSISLIQTKSRKCKLRNQDQNCQVENHWLHYQHLDTIMPSSDKTEITIKI